MKKERLAWAIVGLVILFFFGFIYFIAGWKVVVTLIAALGISVAFGWAMDTIFR